MLDYQADLPDLGWKMSKKEGGGKQGEKDVSGLYKELQTHKQNDDYEKAIKVGVSIFDTDFERGTRYFLCQEMNNFVECPKNQNSTF